MKNNSIFTYFLSLLFFSLSSFACLAAGKFVWQGADCEFLDKTGDQFYKVLKVKSGENMESLKLIYLPEEGVSLKSAQWTAFAPDGSPLGNVSDVSSKADSSVCSLPLSQDFSTGLSFLAFNSNGEAIDSAKFWITVIQPLEKVEWNVDAASCEVFDLIFKPANYYYSEAGSKVLIKRNFDIVYDVFDKDADRKSVTESVEADSLLDCISGFKLPTVNTVFEVTDLDYDIKVKSAEFQTVFADAFASFSVNQKADNEADNDKGWQIDDNGNVFYELSDGAPSGSFRSSAPLNVTFNCRKSPAVNDLKWVITDSTGREEILYNHEKITKTFTEPGKYKVELRSSHTVPDSTGKKLEGCSKSLFGEFHVTSSELYIPNAFTPNGDGKNDEFKVVFKSVASFDCRIYNQWGRKVFETTDITKGWDGKCGSSDEPTGVYFYVIEAKGTDGKKYVKKGTINLLRSAK